MMIPELGWIRQTGIYWMQGALGETGEQMLCLLPPSSLPPTDVLKCVPNICRRSCALRFPTVHNSVYNIIRM